MVCVISKCVVNKCPSILTAVRGYQDSLITYPPPTGSMSARDLQALPPLLPRLIQWWGRRAGMEVIWGTREHVHDGDG